MKILHLISQHPESTGSGFYLQNLLRQATLAGDENYLVAGLSGKKVQQLDVIGTDACRFVHFEQGQLDFLIPGMSDVMPYPSSVFGQLTIPQIDRYKEAFLEVLDQAVAAFTPDIIHSHHLWLASAIARKRFPSLAMVTSCHSTDLRQFQQCPHLRERVLAPCQQIDRILALSHHQAAQIQAIFKIPAERIDVVGGGFDSARFSLQKKVAGEPLQLLYAGKLSLAKGVDCLLRAIRSFDPESVHLHLAGAGSGPEEQCCLALAKEAGALVSVHGRLNQEELARLMGQCHLFILPSFYEGLPLVLLEALASGCRILTTDLDGCRELLGTADADLVEFVELPPLKEIDRPDPCDLSPIEVRLRSAIRSMMARITRCPSPDSQAIAQQALPYSWEAVFARVSSAYRKVLE